MKTRDIMKAVAALKQGQIIAYPTEAVYGLGCDPWNRAAVHRLLDLKHRKKAKGFILIAASWDQITPWIRPVPPDALRQILKSRPRAVTWLYPAKPQLPQHLRGDHDTIAIRLTKHPQAKALCRYFGGPIISTSANREGEPPARTVIALQKNFTTALDYCLPGKLGHYPDPSPIWDLLSGACVRA